MNITDDQGNLKWDCEECGHVWYGSLFVTYIKCPKCECEAIGHY